MHFSIPDTQEFYNQATGSTYTGYNIYINGSFHCCLRYKQLHSFHDQLKRSLPQLILPPFPPKKILPLTPNQLEQRRILLERYIQLIGQDTILSKSELLRIFLLNAQQETSLIDTREIILDIYLHNGYRIQVNCYTTECSTKVLYKTCQNIDLVKEYQNYFSLYLMKRDNDGGIILLRKLVDFEAPYISQRLVNDCKIVLRKCYWDPCYDNQLMKDNIALNLLYIQTVNDIERGWIITTNDIKEQLKTLQDRGNKREYLEVARRLPSYGCIKFSNSTIDYPEPNTVAVILIGNKELSVRTSIGSKIQETKFKVTRMRCWRVTTIHGSGNISTKTKTSITNTKTNSKQTQTTTKLTSNSSDDIDNQIQNFELSFEYLMNKNFLKWITISSEHAMLMSVCLQGMVDELINQKDGNDYSNFNIKHSSYAAPLSYLRRDGGKISNYHNEQNMSDSSSSDTISSLNEVDMANQSPQLPTLEKSFYLRRKGSNNCNSSAKISNCVVFRNGRDSVQNEAFEGIGDDDL